MVKISVGTVNWAKMEIGRVKRHRCNLQVGSGLWLPVDWIRLQTGQNS